MKKRFVWMFAALASLNMVSAFADNQDEAADQELQEVAVVEEEAAE
ncbi:MAG: hypothetical protein K940chlam2_00836 [Chlamydiae bacterium]|nr:hypothetical protein [Chlamydiota bacterium]